MKKIKINMGEKRPLVSLFQPVRLDRLGYCIIIQARAEPQKISSAQSN
nr:hypothetical protein [uncultured Acetatifactor sp.]